MKKYCGVLLLVLLACSEALVLDLRREGNVQNEEATELVELSAPVLHIELLRRPHIMMRARWFDQKKHELIFYGEYGAQLIVDREALDVISRSNGQPIKIKLPKETVDGKVWIDFSVCQVIREVMEQGE